MQSWWARKRGRQDPNLRIDQTRGVLQGGMDEVMALHGVSIEVNEGEILGIIGKNGAGKSTLLKILSRVTAPSSGEVKIRGRVASLLEVGTGFHPELTGRENIYLNGSILGMTKREIAEKFDEIVEFAGVNAFIETPVKRYSSGMHVRLAFAVAAHLEPEILVVDEVLAVGDAEFQKKCLGKMSEVALEGRTVLFVSHNMEAVQNLCTGGIVLKQGEVVYRGSARDAVSSYMKNFLVSNVRCDWEQSMAPGDAEHKLLSAEVLMPSSPGTPLYTSDEIRFRFRYWTRNSRDLLDVTYHLRDENGILVLVDSSVYRDHEKYGIGEVTLCATIPANILNEGTYSIGWLLLVANRAHVVAQAHDVLTFELLPSPNGQFGWQGHKEGVIRVRATTWCRIEGSDHAEAAKTRMWSANGTA